MDFTPPSVMYVMNDKINFHLFNCRICNDNHTYSAARVQLLMQEVVTDSAHRGYISVDDVRFFERTNNILRKRIARIHASTKCENCGEGLPLRYEHENGLNFCDYDCNFEYAGGKSH